MNRLLIVLLLVSSSQILRAQEFTDPVSYLNYVGTQFEEISKDMMSYTSAAAHGKSARKVEKRRNELIQTVKAAEINMRKLKPYKGDRSFRDSVVSYFHITGLVLNEDYGKIVNMEEIAEQSYDLMEAYLLTKEKANEKMDEAYDRVHNQQKVFAEKNNIKLVETSDKLSEKIKMASLVSQYNNQVYLVFFKSYKDEAYLIEALNKSDVNALEQLRGSLDKNSTDGMKQLAKINSFNNDASLKNACAKALDFYKSEAAKTLQLIDFLLKKENFEKTQKALEAKRPSERTKQDIDQYNKTLDEFNASVNKFNALNNDLNKNRNSVLNAWNKASSDFMDNHTPKYR